MITLAADVDNAVRTRWSMRGAMWAESLADELDTLCAALRVTPRQAYPARFAFVVQAVTETGVAFVLRSSPDPDAGHQAAVLSRLSDVGLAPRVHAVESTPTATWTVSDAIEPGTALRDATPEQRRRADVTELLRTLSKDHQGPANAPGLMPWIRSRLIAPPSDDLPPARGPAPEYERRAAIALLEQMEPLPAVRLCHGDLSPGNVLIGRDRPWLIDPRGINGEPAYDVAVAALKASHDDPAQARQTAAVLADAAGVDVDRATQWVPIAAAARV